MAHLILPSRRIVQPQGAVEIDWSNPLTRGLVLAANYSQPDRELVSRQPVSTTRTRGAGPAGKNITGTSGLVTYPNSAALQGATGEGQPRTILLLLATTTTANTVIAEKSANTNFVCQTLNSKFSWRIAGNGTYASDTTSSITSGAPVAVAGSYDGVTQRVYHSGRMESSRLAAAGDADNSYPFVVGAREGNLYAFPGDIYCCYVWRRALSDAEVAALSANPWQIFKPVTRRIYFDVGAASGGGTTYTDSFTESLTASDTHSQSAIFANAISEGLTAADSYLHNAVFADTLSYGITADDALGHIQSILETLTESVTAGFTQSDSLTSGSGTTYNENITESLTAAYSVVDSATFVNALNEALTVSESLADNAVYSVLVNEALTAVSTFADSTPGATTLTAADLAAIDALIVARIADIAAATLAAAQVTPIQAITQDRVIEGTLTEAEAQRIMLSALAGRVTKSGTNIKFKSVDGLTDRIDGTVDDLGNRTAVTLDGRA